MIKTSSALRYMDYHTHNFICLSVPPWPVLYCSLATVLGRGWVTFCCWCQLLLLHRDCAERVWYWGCWVARWKKCVAGTTVLQWIFPSLCYHAELPMLWCWYVAITVSVLYWNAENASAWLSADKSWSMKTACRSKRMCLCDATLTCSN